MIYKSQINNQETVIVEAEPLKVAVTPLRAESAVVPISPVILIE